jgi:hypothetical protein
MALLLLLKLRVLKKTIRRQVNLHRDVHTSLFGKNLTLAQLTSWIGWVEIATIRHEMLRRDLSF